MKFHIHLTVHDILGRIDVGMCFCLQTCILAVNMVVMVVIVGQNSIVLPFIMYYAPSERTREIIYACAKLRALLPV